MLKGCLGELEALKHLVALGYIWLASNLRSTHTEIDLLFIHPKANKIVIVEVKTSASIDWHSESVNRLSSIKFYCRESLAKSFCAKIGLASWNPQHDFINIFTLSSCLDGRFVNKVEHFQDIYI